MANPSRGGTLQSHGTLRVSRVAESDWELTKRTYSSSSKASWLLERTGEVRDAGKRSAGLRGPRHEHFGPFDHCGSPNRRVGWKLAPALRAANGVGGDHRRVVAVAIQDDSEDHLQLDPAQPGGHRRHLPPHHSRRAKCIPVTFSIDASAKGSCSISGAAVTFVAVGTCVIDANQAGNANYGAATQVQQILAILGTQSITFTSNPPSPRSSEAPTSPRRVAGRVATRSPSRSMPRRMGAAASRVPPSPSSPSGPASSTPTRLATPTTGPPRRSSSPSPFSASRASPSPRPRPTQGSWEAPTR